MTQTDGLRPQLRLILAESYRKRPGRVSAISALTVASALVEGVSLVLLVPILQTLTGDGTVTVDLAGQRVTLALGTMLIAFVLLIVLRVAFQRYCAVTTSRLRMEMVDDLRLDALGALLNARWSYFLGRRSGDLLHTIHTDANRAGLAVDRASALAGNLAMVLVLAGVALFVSPALAAVSIVITLVAMAMALPLVRASHRIGARMGQSGRDLSSETVNALDSMRLIRAHDAADAWLTSLSDRTADVRRAAIANQHRSALTGGVLQVASAVGAAVVIGVGYINGAGVETLLVLVLVMARMLASAGSMTHEFQMLAASAPALAMILGLTEDARAHSDGEEPSTRSGADPVIDLRTPPADFDGGGPPRIEVQDVSFTYPNATDPSLTNLSLDVAPGQVTALAGHSGAGKSTTVDLVLGLLRPDEGRISVNGVNLNRIDLKRWRDTIAYVPQDPTLMDDTLRRNLRIGLPNHADGSDAACLAALAAAGAGPSFLARLTDGLDTEIGDRGVRLSGGERQRVALARALLRRPTLLVLDEATSALDDATEAVVHERVRALRGHCTVLVVAHRASTLAIADTIFTLESGALRKSRTTGTSTR